MSERTREESLELLVKRDNPNRRNLLSGAGKLVYPMLTRIATAQINKEYKSYVYGRDNIPSEDLPIVFVGSHQDHEDTRRYLTAVERPVDTLAAIDGDSSSSDWLQLELVGVVPVLRGDDDLARDHQAAAYREMIRNIRKGRSQFVYPEATYCLAFNNMLGLHKGSAIGVAMETGSLIVPVTAVYVPNRDYGIEAGCVEFGQPFSPSEYKDSIVAARALRDRILEMKIERNKEFNPGMTQNEWNMFIAARMKKYPTDDDYYGGIEYSINPDSDDGKYKTPEKLEEARRKYKPQLQQAA